MNKIEIMVAGHNEQRLQTAASLLESHFTCIAIPARGIEAAIEQFYRNDLDIIILDHDLEAAETAKLESLLSRQNRDLVWARLQPGDEVTVVAEAALDNYYTARQASVAVQDDAFHASRINITIE